MNNEIFPTMITPYKKDGTVDFETAEKYVDWYFQKGCTGIFSVCQSSEIFYLSLPERVELNKRVYARAKSHDQNFTVVSSGHISDTLEEQIEELGAIYNSGTDALILITNRLAKADESDDVFIANAEKIISALPADAKFGLYECPHPYKRLVTPKILKWCLSTGKFYYMKDTCCNADIIAERNKILCGTHFKLLNANCQTLLQSLKSGGKGYCGIMANFHPELYVWLCNNFKNQPELAEKVQNLIGTVGFTEIGMPYPLTAKYSMCLEGISTENIARNRESAELTEYMKESTRQMHKLCIDFYDYINKEEK